MKRLAIAVLLLAGIASAESKYLIKTIRLGISDVAITCANGNNPAINKVGNTLIISCGN